MKIFFPIFIFVAITNISAQQQTLTATLNAYRAADELVKQQVKFKDPGSSGKGCFWDFRALQPINEYYKLDYFIPDSTIMTRLCGLENGTRYYYSQENDTLRAIGYENSTTWMEYTQPELRMRFPFAYGDTLFSYFLGKGIYCHRDSLKLSGYTRVKFDAEGELQLPGLETVKKALRVHTLRHYTQTGIDSVKMNLDTYSWYAAGIRYPVFESVKTTVLFGETDTTIFATSFYYPPDMQTSQVETDELPDEILETLTGAAAIFTEAQVMPNPVETDLYIYYKLTRPAKVWFTISNIVGIPQCQTSPQNLPEGYNNTIINMASLNTGVYSLNVYVDDMLLRINVVKK